MSTRPLSPSSQAAAEEHQHAAEPILTVINPLNFRAKSSNALSSLDHAHVEGLSANAKAAFELDSRMDDDAQFLRECLVGPQSILQMALKPDCDELSSMQDVFQSNVLSQPSALDLEARLKALVAKIRGSKLATLQFLRLAKSRPTAAPSLVHLFPGLSKTAAVESHLHYVATSHIPDGPDRVEPVSEPELLLSVCIFQPNRPQLVKAQEFLMLGSNTLASLRDRIYCITDTILREERQEQYGSGSAASVPKEPGPGPISSGFFLIEKTFYADQRAAIDPTPGLLRWIRERSTHPASRYHGQGSAYTIHPESMEQVRWIDLPKLTLNAPYLYAHTGGCEHILMISQVRLLSTSLYSPNALNYPLTVYHSKLRKRKCRVCDIYGANFVTFDDQLAPENPCYFCKQCYEDFHYDAQGRLVYSDFEVYKYIHE